MIYPQALLGLHREIIVDLFAGGGGASCGIELATGRMVDVAVNHDRDAIAMHEINHPQTRHLRSDVFEIDPLEVTRGRPVGLLWGSPDCTFFSKAKGGQPFRDKKRRSLAWVLVWWAAKVQPRIIMLENVEEFQDWGPLLQLPDGRYMPDKTRKGETFRRWVARLEELGYVVEWRELRACDFGAPTIRKRLFVIARRDGEPIVWPEPTHAPNPPKRSRLKPYRTAAECIDWSVPMCSVFATRQEARVWGKLHGQRSPKRPLAENTMKRIARGIQRYVLNAADPYLIQVGYGERVGQYPRCLDINDPLGTVVGTAKHAVVTPVISTYYGAKSDGDARGGRLDGQLGTQTTENRHAVVAPILTPYYGSAQGGRPVDEPAATQTTRDRYAVCAAWLAQHNGDTYPKPGRDVRQPISTITTAGSNQQLCVAHLMTNTTGHAGGPLYLPMHTLTTGHHQALVVAFLHQYLGLPPEAGLLHISGHTYVIVDILMRMLQPHELYAAQGFPSTYITDKGAGGKPLTKASQVRMCGNAVPPPFSAALVRANCPELIVRHDRKTIQRARQIAPLHRPVGQVA